MSATEVREVDQQLRLAIYHNDLGAARRALDEGANTKGTFFFESPCSGDDGEEDEEDGEDYSYQMSVLTLCWAENFIVSTEMLRLLLEHGADANEGGDETPLMSVINRRGSDRAAAVSLLLDYGADVNDAGSDWFSPLALAAHHGDLQMIGLLIDRGASINQSRQRPCNVPSSGGTPLGVAVMYGRLDAARMLLDRGADIEQEDHNRVTPLFHALKNGKVGLVKLLLARGADLEHRVEMQVYKLDVRTSRMVPSHIQATSPATLARARACSVLERNHTHAAQINAALDVLLLARCVVAIQRQEAAPSLDDTEDPLAARRAVFFDRNLTRVIAKFLVVK